MLLKHRATYVYWRSRRAYVCETNRSRAGQCLGCLRAGVRTCVFFSAFYIQERVSSTYPACTHVRMHACTRASAALPRERSTRDVRERSRMISAKLAAYSHVGISIQLELDMRLTLLLKENSKTVFLVLRKMFWFIINKWKWFIKKKMIYLKKMKNGKWFI